MKKLAAKDIKAIALFSVLFGLLILGLLFGDPVGSRKAAGGIVLGPVVIGYAFSRLQRGKFLLISAANREDHQVLFWAFFLGLLISGFGLLVIGIQHFAGR